MAAQGRLDELYDAARRAAEHRDEAFETILLRYRREIYQALSGSDLYMTQQFEIRVSRPDDYTDLERFNELKALGQSYIENGETHKLRGVISRLSTIRKPDEELDTEDMYEDVNVLRG